MTHTTADALLPARFLTTIAHFITTLMVFFTKDIYVRAALPIGDSSQYASYDNSLTAALALSWVCFAIELFGLFSGMTTFNQGAGTLYLWAHTAGIIALIFFVLEGWHYMIYWYIFTFCSALPALIETGLLLLVTLLRVNQY
ncbi:uncharacterized protein SPPG_09416 [Spizellomyces punctatus DAOM BR117]|uniref:Transmembrane protein 107 n=1 Tax=Spizellomyces punctatus (strain DAOM BR117) TaxID=645134 RepID=A0A0L0HA38_SPIPD|nr:uncharacterized protein SPPG_09416 [Spizellomyces punctatus DAOM BR117]KNC97876.1 hypothetical protein SPPG_09416 [Spizellomyces punctatus DAOM BR117]|eukprot:XP_016605916.1 hypothetical protein SPPG_09416 [Spizellomyces punctatus DAOM BR117]